jgi:nitroimidazol reductase NimA-like FMN-containing flavoprotein (pyridoxamine 5'-phosphate oxidase superfamily)
MVATDRTKLRRAKEKGHHDRASLLDVLRAGFLCHLGVVVDGQPMVVPTVYGVSDDEIYFHGSVASRSLTQDTQVCVTVTHVDGLIIARSVFEHSVRYRSAMIYGVPRVVTDPEEKVEKLRLLTEHVTPGQWDYARQPVRKELAATTLLALSLDEASAKISNGWPDDEDEDLELDVWAGVLPMTQQWGKPLPAPDLREGIPFPGHLNR